MLESLVGILKSHSFEVGTLFCKILGRRQGFKHRFEVSKIDGGIKILESHQTLGESKNIQQSAAILGQHDR